MDHTERPAHPREEPPRPTPCPGDPTRYGHHATTGLGPDAVCNNCGTPISEWWEKPAQPDAAPAPPPDDDFDESDPELSATFDEACLAIQRVRDFLEPRLRTYDVQPAMELLYRVGHTHSAHDKLLALRAAPAPPPERERIACGHSHPDPKFNADIDRLRESEGAPPDTSGCGAAGIWPVMYRCVECARWFHRDCIRKHFAAHGAPAGTPPNDERPSGLDIATTLVALEVCATIQDEQQGGDGSASMRRVAAWLRAPAGEPTPDEPPFDTQPDDTDWEAAHGPGLDCYPPDCPICSPEVAGTTVPSVAAPEPPDDDLRQWPSERELRSQIAALDAHVDELLGEIARLRTALEEIEEGRGPFSTDQETFAINVIENLTGIARAALRGGRPPNQQEGTVDG